MSAKEIAKNVILKKEQQSDSLIESNQVDWKYSNDEEVNLNLGCIHTRLVWFDWN